MPWGTVRIRVRYEETDCSGVVYHANYFKYFEVGRTELMRSLGAPYRELEDLGLLLTVVEADAHYQSPARYDDLLRVDTALAEHSGARVRFHYRVFDDATGALLCSGSTRLGCLDQKSGRARRLPESLQTLFSSGSKSIK